MFSVALVLMVRVAEPLTDDEQARGLVSLVKEDALFVAS